MIFKACRPERPRRRPWRAQPRVVGRGPLPRDTWAWWAWMSGVWWFCRNRLVTVERVTPSRSAIGKLKAPAPSCVRLRRDRPRAPLR